MVQFIAPFLIFLYLPFQNSQKWLFKDLGGKCRNNLGFLPGWEGLRWGDMEFWVHQKSVFVQFEICFSTHFQPLWISVVGQVCPTYKILLPTKTDNKIQPVRVERAYGFCFKEFHSFCKRPPHSAHRSLKLARRSFLKLIVNKHSVWKGKTVSLIFFVEFQPTYKLNIINI